MVLHLSPEELRLRHRAQIKRWREQHPAMVRAYRNTYDRKPAVLERRRVREQQNKESNNARRRQNYLKSSLESTQAQRDAAAACLGPKALEVSRLARQELQMRQVQQAMLQGQQAQEARLAQV
jgi:hypothetical protein